MSWRFWRPCYRDFCNRGIYERCRRENTPEREENCRFCGRAGCGGRCRHHRGCECEQCRRCSGNEMHKAFIEGCVGDYRVKFDICKK